MTISRRLGLILALCAFESLLFLVILYFFRSSQIYQALLFEQILFSVLLTLALTLLIPTIIKSLKLRILSNFPSLHFRYLSAIIAGIIFFAGTSSILNIDRSRSFFCHYLLYLTL